MAGDRRVKYTKMVLRESLIKLLQKKPISRITVKELCDLADINRATFYTHYADQFDLLRKISDEFIADITSYVYSGLKEGESGLMQMITIIFEYIDKNSELCRVLLGMNVDIDIQTYVMQIIKERIVLEWRKKKLVDQSTVDYIYTYVATGCIGVIRKWLYDGDPRTPGEMAALITKLANEAVAEFHLSQGTLVIEFIQQFC